MIFMKKKDKSLNVPISVGHFIQLKEENKYLRQEMKEEKEKLENTIKILNKEIEEIKDDNRKLINEVEHYVRIKENMYNIL
tara:strand:+ start:261 stop:503 length:243 start_codon:yes stop_codon:yes gene_type:complete